VVCTVKAKAVLLGHEPTCIVSIIAEQRKAEMTVRQSAPGNLSWHVSRTCDGGVCVAVAHHGDSVLFGRGREPEGPVYVYTVDEWREFLAGVKQGDFDDVA
jgi:hypothetical protein